MVDKKLQKRINKLKLGLMILSFKEIKETKETSIKENEKIDLTKPFQELYGINISKATEEAIELLESIITIDKNNIEIAETNGSLKKERVEIKKRFLIPDLKKREDEHLELLSNPRIDNTIETIRSEWEDSLSKEDKRYFEKETLEALKRLNLSFGLNDWIKKYILYGKKEKITKTYYINSFNFFINIDDSFPLSTAEKKIFKIKIREFFKHIKIKKHDDYYKFFLEKIDKMPLKKQRRKPRLKKAIKAISEHGKFYDDYNYAELKNDKTKQTDRELAAKIYPEEDDVPLAAERIKKLRQRYKRKLEK